MRNILCYFLLIVIMFGQFDVNAQKKELVFPCSVYHNISSNGAWCWFSDPCAVYVNSNYEMIYAGYVDSEGSIKIAGYDLKSKQKQEVLLDEKFNL